MTLRHASFFSGIGGLDLGFKRAGIETVSVSEIDPYASSVLAERFPDALNLGDITEVNADDIPQADIYSGGFPCQDLSVAGRRAGFAGKRSSLAFTFLDLVERRRPRWVVLENVTGLFSSNRGRDFGRLIAEVESLGYGVAWRTLDARYFGVPQRRRRVFIVASLESDRAGEVLFECDRCERHPAPRWSQRSRAASDATDGTGTSSAIQAHYAKWIDAEGAAGNQLVIGQATDTDGMRASDGVPRRLVDQQVVAYQTRVDEKNDNFSLNETQVANSLSALWPGDTSHRSMTLVQAQNETVLSFPVKFGTNATVTEDQAQSFAHSAGAPAVFRKAARARTSDDSETWVDDGIANTLNTFDVGDVRTTHAIIGGAGDEATVDDDPLLPLGLDTHRYRCCGNGVVAPVAEWIGRRIVHVDALHS